MSYQPPMRLTGAVTLAARRGDRQLPTRIAGVREHVLDVLRTVAECDDIAVSATAVSKARE